MNGRIIDLRTDAVTQPTEAMWRAMQAAPLGWAPAGEDPSVERIQERGAKLTGKESALFLPTGSMGNLVALLSATERGEQVVLEASSHIAWSEEWAYASLCGVTARAIEGRSGALQPEDVEAALTDRRFNHQPHTALVCLENTHNMAGGTVITPDQTETLAEVAHRHGARVHLDGARIFNAAVALDVPVRDLTAPADSVMVGLSKGLSAPGGALLCGSSSVIGRARAALRQIGGHSMSQAGLLAAAGLVALDEMIPRLADDHRRARSLAQGLAAVEGLQIDRRSVQTNIVMVRLDPENGTAQMLADALREHGIRAYLYLSDTLRFVTHRHIDDDAVQQVIEAAVPALERLRGMSCSTC